jgi:hypothetical protein
MEQSDKLKNKLGQKFIGKLNNRMKFRLKASHTLEIAFYTPLMLFTIITVIYFALISHDRLILSYIMRDSLIRSIGKIENEQIFSESIITDEVKSMEDLLFLIKNTQYKASIMGTKIKLECIGEGVISFVDVAEILDVTGKEEIELQMNKRQVESLLRLKGMMKLFEMEE